MNAPITLSSTYVQDATVEYGRDGNAGWGALEAALGALDGGRAVTFASGLAAATAIADLVPAGGTVVLSTVTYFGVRNIFERLQAHGRLTSAWPRPTTPPPSSRRPRAPTWSGSSRSRTR